MNAQKRPQRQRKADRLLSPGSSKSEIECDYGIAPMDRLARELDAKWGIERLPELVSITTAQKYGVAIAHLNQCIQDADPAKCAAAAQNCVRGLQAMDAEATAAGKEPATGDFWEYELKGASEPFRFAVMRDGAEWQAAKAKRPDLTFFTMREVAIALEAKMNSSILQEVKKHMPGATVTKIKPNPPVDYAGGGDEIHFQ